MQNKIEFILNEQSYRITNKTNINELLTYFNYDPYIIVLEYNGVIQAQKSWLNLQIKENDKFEIITIVGGG